MNDLTGFLLARIAEDEQWSTFGCADEHEGLLTNPSCRDRVLAECEAKRRIVEWHKNWPVLIERQPDFHDLDPGFTFDSAVQSATIRMTRQFAWATEQQYRETFGTEPPTGPILRLLALPYADHPDYRDEWRPS